MFISRLISRRMCAAQVRVEVVVVVVVRKMMPVVGISLACVMSLGMAARFKVNN